VYGHGSHGPTTPPGGLATIITIGVTVLLSLGPAQAEDSAAAAAALRLPGPDLAWWPETEQKLAAVTGNLSASDWPVTGPAWGGSRGPVGR